jgi:hypothetical protein
MTQTLIRRVAIAGALTAVLTLAAPAHAAGWNYRGASDLDVFQTAWRWVASFWTPQLNGPGSVLGTAKSDRGAGTDPDGRQNTSPVACQVNCGSVNGTTKFGITAAADPNV